MADWCPSPEERNIIVGVAVSFNYAVDSFANSQLPSYPSITHAELVSPDLPCIRSTKL